AFHCPPTSRLITAAVVGGAVRYRAGPTATRGSSRRSQFQISSYTNRALLFAARPFIREAIHATFLGRVVHRPIALDVIRARPKCQAGSQARSERGRVESRSLPGQARRRGNRWGPTCDCRWAEWAGAHHHGGDRGGIGTPGAFSHHSAERKRLWA